MGGVLTEKPFEMQFAGAAGARTELRVGDGEGGAARAVAAQLTQKAVAGETGALGFSGGLGGNRYLRILIEA